MKTRIRKGVVYEKEEKYFFLMMLLLLSMSSCLSSQDSKKDPPPNIILFLVDDLGWSDASYMGSEFYETPHIDELANQGMIFTNAYANAPNCAPSRASILSGYYPSHHGVYTVGSSERGEAVDRALIPVKNNRILESSYITLAESLKSAGYTTGHIGKWHLGEDSLSSPTAQGFDVNIGGNHSGHPKSYFSPYHNPNLKDGADGEYLIDRLSEEALTFIEDHKEAPFFLYFAHYAVHTPIQAKADVKKKYIDKPSSHEQDQAAYAAMIESTDQSLGRLVSKLKELDLTDNTLIVFFSDNGGHGGITSNWPLRGSKGMMYEGGIRVPMIASFPGRINPKTICKEPVIGIDFYPTFMELANQKVQAMDLDGESLLPLFYASEQEFEREAIYWHFPAYLEGYQNIKHPENLIHGLWRACPSGAIRCGDWKLIEYFEDGSCQLFNLKEDMSEKNNLIEENPEMAEKLLVKLKEWRLKNQADMPQKKAQKNG